jgi:hypothetical protein
MLLNAAREGKHPELIRAALSAESPPFATQSWSPLLPDAAAQEVREWVFARRSPESVQDLRAAWRLGRLADELQVDMAGGQTAAPARTLEELGAVRIGLR